MIEKIIIIDNMRGGCEIGKVCKNQDKLDINDLIFVVCLSITDSFLVYCVAYYLDVCMQPCN